MLRRNLSLPPNKQRQTGVSLPPSHMRASSVVPHCDQRISQRDTKSKAFVTRAITNLIEFLESTEYPNAISTRLLQSPSSKEIFCIFEHVIRQISPTYRIGRPGTKVEDSCLDALTKLGYPYVLSKQYLATPGAPHAWPSVLAALDWLREQVVETHELRKSDSLFKYDDEQDTTREPVGKVLYECTLAELNGQRSMDELAQFDARLRALLGCPSQADFDQMESTIAQINAELHSFGASDSCLEQLQLQVRQLEEELKSQDNKKQDLESRLHKLQLSNREHQRLLAELSERSEQLREQLSSAKKRIKEQEDAGLGRLIQDYRILQEQYQSRIQDKTEIQKEIEQKELAFSRRQGRIAPALDTYNRLVTTLKVPEYEAVAQRCDLKVRTYRSGFDITCEVAAAMGDVSSCLKCIQSLVAEVEEHSVELCRQISETQTSIDNLGLPLLNAQHSELVEQADKLDQLLVTEDTERDKMEQEFAQQRQCWATERSKIHTLLGETRARSDELEATLDRITQRRVAKSEFIEELEFKATVFLPTLQVSCDAPIHTGAPRLRLLMNSLGAFSAT
ncbi:unnamed protein product [Dicrocoelium dendriticum]|nr:unnamed protein product [Dicrocoelium dendriticum]